MAFLIYGALIVFLFTAVLCALSWLVHGRREMRPDRVEGRRDMPSWDTSGIHCHCPWDGNRDEFRHQPGCQAVEHVGRHRAVWDGTLDNLTAVEIHEITDAAWKQR